MPKSTTHGSDSSYEADEAEALLEFKPPLAHLILNRPQKHNALDADMLLCLQHALDQVASREDIRLLTLQAKGKNFCTGADLAWFYELTQATNPKRKKGTQLLGKLIYTLAHMPQPTVALVQGAALGGGAGLLACCDIVLADTTAWFAFSEVKVGLVPAIIAPYVLRRMGYSATCHYFLTAEKFDVWRAKELGFIHQVVQNDLIFAGTQLCDSLLTHSPASLRKVKGLLHDLTAREDKQFALKTANLLSECLGSQETQEGIAAFLNKRIPNWMQRD